MNLIERYIIHAHIREEYESNKSFVCDYDENYVLLGSPDDSFDTCLERFVYQSCIDWNRDFETNIVMDILNKNIIIRLKSEDIIVILKIYKIEECPIIVD